MDPKDVKQEGPFAVWTDPNPEATVEKLSGWWGKSYLGAEILDLENSPIPNTTELVVGQEIWAPFFHGPIRAIVEVGESGKFFARSTSGDTMWFLEKSNDDRQAWVSQGAINLKALEKIDFAKVEMEKK